MSAYVVGPEHIKYLAKHIVNEVNGRNSHAFRAYGCETEESLGKKLWDLNVNAVCQRYSGDSKETYGEYHAPSGYRVGPFEKIQFLKSLRCFLYQCSEGDVPETSILFQALEKTGDALAWSIVDGMSAYDSAKWGAPESSNQICLTELMRS